MSSALSPVIGKFLGQLNGHGLGASGRLKSGGPLVRPMPLAACRQPFKRSRWVLRAKWDGFRALAYIDGHEWRLVSRSGHVLESWPYLAVELAHAVRCRQEGRRASVASGHEAAAIINATESPRHRPAVAPVASARARLTTSGPDSSERATPPDGSWRCANRVYSIAGVFRPLASDAIPFHEETSWVDSSTHSKPV